MAVKKYLEKCFPIICNEVLIGVGNMLINVVLGRQTEQAIAAVAVFRTMEGLIIAFFSGFPIQPRYWSEKKSALAITRQPFSGPKGSYTFAVELSVWPV